MGEDCFFSTLRSCDKRERRIMKKSKPKKKKVKKQVKDFFKLIKEYMGEEEMAKALGIEINKKFNEKIDREVAKFLFQTPQCPSAWNKNAKLPKNWGKVNGEKFFDLIEGNLTT